MFPENELLQEGRYRITRLTGQNDAGFIYEGFDNIFEKDTIINQLAGDDKQNTSAEEKKLKDIKHDVFLRIADYFTEKNARFVVMEAADGEFFNDIFRKSEDIQKFPDVMNWTEQLLEGLSYLHLHMPPVIYGDLKPQNIILTSSGKIKVLASAILKSRNLTGGFGKPSTAALNYSPLEQVWNGLDSASQKAISGNFDENSEKILRQPVDARCDIYSLGVLMYQMLTNQFPKNALERSIDILEANPDPLVSPNSLNAEIPPEISEIIIKALEIKREKRFDSAVIMRQVLRTAFVRIREREAKEAQLQTNAQTTEPQESFMAVESFALKEGQTIETKSVSKDTENFDEESFSGLLELDEAADVTENSSNNQNSEIENLSLMLTEEEPEEIAENDLAAVSPEQTVESADLEFSAEKNSTQAFELEEQTAAEEKDEIEPKKITGEFFDFDESDEKEILEIQLPIRKIPKTEKIPELVEETERTISVSEAVKVSPEIPKSDYKREYEPDEFSNLFENTEVKSRSKLVIPVIILVLILVGGGVFGVFMYGSKAEPNTEVQTISSQTAAPTVNTESNLPVENPAQIETATQTVSTDENNEQTANTNTANTEPATQTEAETNPVLAGETTSTARKQETLKAKPNISKTQTASVKTPEKSKKKVTVDDLISDY
ncbi:MAG: protein kinase [Pyrinomonadaceae bacterium]